MISIRAGKDCRLMIVIAAMALMPAKAHSSWLSEITGVDINVPAGTVNVQAPNPEAIPRMLENLPRDVGQALLNPAGAALATSIRHAAAQAMHGSRSIPSSVRTVLAPFFPSSVLDGTTWNVYDPNRITIDSAIDGLFCQNNAITLDTVVVFPDEASAQDWDLWSHELVHALQYRNMGVEGFANVYSVNWESLEQEARSWQEQVRGRVESSWQTTAPPPDWQSQRFFTGSPAATSSSLTSADFRSAAREYYPPMSCVTTQETPQALWVANVCPVPVRVMGWVQRNPYNGMLVPIACGVNCWVPPGANMPFQSPAPGPMVHVDYNYE